MRSKERDLLLFFLAIAAGAADGWSYMGLGHAFVANMTGNTVLLGLAVFQHRDLLHPAIALACYVVGTTLATLITRRVPDGAVWARSVSWVLLVEAVLMGAAELGWAMSHGSPNLLLGAVALGIGMQSGAMVRLKVPGVVTTYITGTWTTLASGATQFATRHNHQPPRERLQYEERLFLQAAIVGLYFLSAVLTGFLFQHAPAGAGLVPALAVLLVSFYGFARV